MSNLEQFWQMLQQPEHARAVAYSATLLCVLISAHAAKSLKASPRLFNVMVLFTCAWLVLLGAYATDTTKTAAARDLDLAAILLLYAGGALMQEGRERYSYEAVGWAQDNALKKMIFLALPGGLAFGDFGSQWGLAKLGVSGPQLKIALGATTYISALVALSIGIWRLNVSPLRTVFSIAATTYVGLIVYQAYVNWSPASSAGVNSEALVYAFASANLVLVLAFAGNLALHAARIERRGVLA